MSTYMYGALSLVLLAGTAVLGRRAFNDYATKHSIKKEIKKRFKFGDNSDNEAGHRSIPSSGPADGGEESKNNNASTRDFNGAKNMIKNAAAKLASKVNLTKQKEVEENDPAKYYTLDDGPSDSSRASRMGGDDEKK